MNKQILKLFFIAAIMLICLSASATKRYWRGTGADKKWNNTANWSATSGGATGSSVPVSADSVYFDSSGDSVCSIDATVSIRYLNLSSGYTKSIDQNSYAITIGTSGAVMSGGTFYGGSANITVNGIFTLSGTNFTSTSALLNIKDDYAFSSGSFIHNNGEVTFTVASMTITGNTDFYNLTFSPATSGIFTIGSSTTLTCNHTLTTSSSSGLRLNAGTIHAKGDILINNTYSANAAYFGGTATIEINGTAKQTFTGASTAGKGVLCNITINKSSDTLVLANTISVAGNWVYTQGIIDATTNNSTVAFANGTKTISGKHTLDNVCIYATINSSINNINATDTITVLGNLTNEGANTAYINTGVIILKGDITINNTNTSSANTSTATILINGTSNQTINGASAISRGKLCNIIINKSSDTLILKGYVNIGKNWTYVQGALDATTYNSTVAFGTMGGFTRTITGKHSLNNVTFVADGTAQTNTMADTLTVLGLAKYVGTGVVGLNGILNLKGDFTTNNPTYSYGGTGTILFSGTSDQTLNGSTISLGGLLPTIKIKKASGTIILKNYVSVFGSWILNQGDLDATTHSSSVILYSNAGRTISGSQTFYNLKFTGPSSTNVNNIGASDTLTVEGDLKIEGSTQVSINTGIIKCKGNFTVSNANANSGGTGLIKICGTGNQILTGSGIVGSGGLCDIEVNKPSGTLTLSSIISLNTANWTYIQGTIEPSTSTVVCDGSGNFSCGTVMSTAMPFNNFKVYSGTATLAGVMKLNGNLIIDASRTLNANGKQITIGGNWYNSGTFTHANSIVAFKGTGAQYLIKSSGTETFYIFGVNKPSGVLHLTKPINVNDSLVMLSGVIATTSTNIINIPDNVTSGAGNDSSYVCGPIKKTGNDAFTFPLGDTTLLKAGYHPLSITAPSVATDAYTAQYFPTNQTYGSTIQTDSLNAISNCEYWVLTRNTGSSTVIPTVGWNTNSCNIYGAYDIAVVGWNGSQWNTLGKSATTYGTGTGTVSALIGLSISTLPIAIGNPIQKKPTSECVLKKKLDAGFYISNNGYIKFKFDEEYVNNGSELEFKIYDKNRTVVVSDASVGATLNVVNKDNRWGINVKAINPSLPAGYYVLEVKDRKGEISMLRFKI